MLSSCFRSWSPSSLVLARSTRLGLPGVVLPESVEKNCSVKNRKYSHSNMMAANDNKNSTLVRTSTLLEKELSKKCNWTMLQNNKVVILQSRSFAKMNKKKKKRKASRGKETVEEEEASYSTSYHAGDDSLLEENEEEPVDPLPSAESVRNRMESLLSSMELAYKSFLPSPDAIPFGDTTALGEVAQVRLPSPRLAVVTPYDPGLAEDVRDAVRNADLGLNPSVDNNSSSNRSDEPGDVRITIPLTPEIRLLSSSSENDRQRLVKEVGRIPLPKISNRTRQRLVREVGQTTEKFRQRVRGVRRKTNDRIKRAKEGKLDGVSRDDAFRVAKDIDKVTEEIMRKINAMSQQKEKSIMNVKG